MDLKTDMNDESVGFWGDVEDNGGEVARKDISDRLTQMGEYELELGGMTRDELHDGDGDGEKEDFWASIDDGEFRDGEALTSASIDDGEFRNGEALTSAYQNSVNADGMRVTGEEDPHKIDSKPESSALATTTKPSVPAQSVSAECISVASVKFCSPLSTILQLNLTAASIFYNRMDAGNGSFISRPSTLTLTDASSWEALINKMSDGTVDSFKELVLPQLPCKAATGESEGSSTAQIRYLRTFLCARDLLLTSSGCNKELLLAQEERLPPIAKENGNRVCPKDQEWCNDFVSSLVGVLRAPKNGNREKSRIERRSFDYGWDKVSRFDKGGQSFDVPSSSSTWCPFQFGVVAAELAAAQCRRLATIPIVFGDGDTDRPSRFGGQDSALDVQNRGEEKGGLRRRSHVASKEHRPSFLRSPQLSALKVRMPQVASCGLGVELDFQSCGFSSYTFPSKAKADFCKSLPMQSCCIVPIEDPSNLNLKKLETSSSNDVKGDNGKNNNTKSFGLSTAAIVGAVIGVLAVILIAAFLAIFLRKRRNSHCSRGLPRGKPSKVRFGTVSGTSTLISSRSSLSLFGSSSSPTLPSLPQREGPKEAVVYQVVHKYSKQLPDEMELHRDDSVEVTSTYDDGWARGYNLNTRQRGMFPLACVKPYKQT